MRALCAVVRACVVTKLTLLKCSSLHSRAKQLASTSEEVLRSRNLLALAERHCLLLFLRTTDANAVRRRGGWAGLPDGRVRGRARRTSKSVRSCDADSRAVRLSGIIMTVSASTSSCLRTSYSSTPSSFIFAILASCWVCSPSYILISCSVLRTRDPAALRTRDPARRVMKDEVRTAACAAFSCVLVAGVFRQRTHRLITPDLILIWRFVSASAMVAACGYLYKITI